MRNIYESFLKFCKLISNLILGQVMDSNPTNVHKLAALTVLDFVKLDITKTSIKYNNYSGLPFEIQFLKTVREGHSCLRLPTLPVFPGVSKFFIKSPGLPVRAPDLPGNTYRAFLQFFFINFVIFEMSETKIKQEVKFIALLYELFLIGKIKTEQSN